MKLYVVRHGETDWNIVKRLQGRSDTHLNEKGRELAKIVGEALRDIPFTRCYSSPLSRAMETAKLVLGEHNVSIIPEERIAEISFGIYEGMVSDKKNYEIPDPEFMYFFSAPEKYHHPKGGESLESLCARTTEFLRELVENPELEEETILIVTHGAALCGFLSSIQMEDLSQFWSGGVYKNCSVSILEAHHGKVKILETNKVYY